VRSEVALLSYTELERQRQEQLLESWSWSWGADDAAEELVGERS
jgi:hypothetical protein